MKSSALLTHLLLTLSLLSNFVFVYWMIPSGQEHFSR